MTSIRIRPRIRGFSNTSEERLLKKYEEILAEDRYHFNYKIVQNHIFISFKKEESHFWSPELTLEVIRNYLQDDEYSGQNEPTLLRGNISPTPSLWALFLFSYGVLSILCICFLIWGSSQYMLGQPSNMFWYSLSCILLIGLIFITAQIGQKIAENQTEKLLEFVKEGLEQV
jgi:hypothetical protein